MKEIGKENIIMKIAVETVMEVRKKVRSFDIRVEVEKKFERN